MEDHRSTGDYLGQVRKLGQQVPNRDENLAFGIPSGIVRSGGRPRLTAQEVIRGTYTGEDNRPDKDLGRSLTPGFRNTSAEVFLNHQSSISFLRTVYFLPITAHF